MYLKRCLSIIIVTGVIIMMGVSIADPSPPLNLPWGQPLTNRLGRLEISTYRYMYGDPGWGQIRYQGTEDLYEMTNELIVYYTGRKLSSALLILGPGGLNEDNCVRKYKGIISFLNKKYGHFSYQSHTKDPLMDDLLFARKCHAIKVGLEVITTRWMSKEFRIESFLFGDEEDVFIEIEYILLELEKKENEAHERKAIERL